MTDHPQHRLSLQHSLVPQLEHLQREDADADLSEAATLLEERFDCRFDTLTVLSGGDLRSWERREGSEQLPSGVTVLSAQDPSVLIEFEAMKEIANSVSPATQGERFHDCLTRVYRRLPNHAEQLIAEPGTLCVAPEREGALLARELGWLPEGRSLMPQAKRIHYLDGLAIGLKGIPGDLPMYDRCVIIDGAIASGGTIMAIIDQLQRITSRFHVFSVHATTEGLRAISRLAERSGVDVSITVGHASHGLNDHFYAVDERGRPEIGDLGDTICSVP